MKKIAALSIIFLFTALQSFSQSFDSLERLTIEAAEKSGRSVVSISGLFKEKAKAFSLGFPFDKTQNDPSEMFFEEFFGSFPEGDYRRMGLGSGVIISKDGRILTNEHVIFGASQIKVRLSDGRQFKAKVKGADKRSDLAVLTIEAQDLTPAKLADSDKLQVGNWVIAVGSSFGFVIENPQPTANIGVVSALHRYMPILGPREIGYENLIQIDASINPGNSGGPLVNLKGEVVGINTAIITATGSYYGIGFAIPSNKAKSILDKILKGEKIEYGWLGANIQNLNDDLRNYFDVKAREGIMVLKVYKDSPAQKGGLKEGDLILNFNGESIKTARDLSRMVSLSKIDEVIPLQVIRSGGNLVLNIQITKMPQDIEEVESLDQQPKVLFRGMSVGDINPVLRRKFRIKVDQGVVVADIEDGSLADKSGLIVGDLIANIENEVISNLAAFKTVTEKIKGTCLIKTSRGYFVLKN